MQTRKAAQRRVKRRRRQAFLAIAVTGILALGAFLLVPHSAHRAPVAFTDHDEVDHNAEMIQQTFAVQQAVVAYAQAHGGAVPQTASAFDQQIVAGGYLPSKQLPCSPWGGQQKAMLAATPEVRAALAFGDGKGLGKAVVDSEIRSLNTLGALCYEVLGPSEYRLYGIGRGRSGEATVIIQLGSPPSGQAS